MKKGKMSTTWRTSSQTGATRKEMTQRSKRDKKNLRRSYRTKRPQSRERPKESIDLRRSKKLRKRQTA